MSETVTNSDDRSETTKSHTAYGLEPIVLCDLARLQPLKSSVYIALQWSIIVVVAVAASVFHVWYGYGLAIIIISTRQHALAVLIHDAAHGLLYKKRAFNDLISDLFLAFPLFVSTSRYRKHHLSHHRHLNTSQDPDLITETKKNRWQWLRLFFCDITGISALTALKTISTWSILAGVLAQPDSDAAVSPSEKQRFLVFAIAAVGFISLFHLWFEVLIFWLVPLLTVLNAAFRIRNIAEHFGCPNQTKLNASRTVLANPIERFLIAPCNINYHLEHHLRYGHTHHGRILDSSEMDFTITQKQSDDRFQCRCCFPLEANISLYDCNVEYYFKHGTFTAIHPPILYR